MYVHISTVYPPWRLVAARTLHYHICWHPQMLTHCWFSAEQHLQCAVVVVAVVVVYSGFCRHHGQTLFAGHRPWSVQVEQKHFSLLFTCEMLQQISLTSLSQFSSGGTWFVSVSLGAITSRVAASSWGWCCLPTIFLPPRSLRDLVFLGFACCCEPSSAFGGFASTTGISNGCGLHVAAVAIVADGDGGVSVGVGIGIVVVVVVVVGGVVWLRRALGT